ncbi:MAG TPA: hypothetical protein VKQ36_01975 [Ktedonobacterales bacterium]|nr:hypothetical protein [Ktedonobacterales bacterium]
MSDRTVLKRVLLVAGAVALLLVGLVMGVFLGGPLSAFAAGGTSTPTPAPTSSTQQSYCQLYVQTLAQNLGVSVSKLESAHQAAAQKVINQMYADGKITAAQKTKLLNRLKANSSNPCAALAGLPRGHGAGSGNGAFVAGAHAAIVSAVARSLNISTTTLESDLHAGKTIPQIASAQHVSLSAVNTAYLNAVQTQLNDAVKQGLITQTMANTAYTNVKNAVAQGQYPLLKGGPGGPHGSRMGV